LHRPLYARLLALIAASCSPSKPGTEPFDGATAFLYLREQVQFGPRIPNTGPHDQCGAWILSHLRATADTVEIQAFTAHTAKGRQLQLRNYFARFSPHAPERVLYLAHWDTRPYADKSPNPIDRTKAVLGANDGASGVAVLLALADALKKAAPRIGVDLLFTDGEDYGDFSDTTETLLGARYFAAHLPAGYQPLYAVLWDMVGDKDLDISIERNSRAFAPEVTTLVWRAADSLGYGRTFLSELGQPLIDDHIPLQAVGIHAIDVVDFDYGPGNSYHHTIYDTLDKVSAQSLQTVGNVALALVR
jgi:glutaminyl-peptide cyclotransferase